MHAREQRFKGAMLARVTRRALACVLPLVATIAPAAWARDPITPLSDIHRGLHCTARTVVQGTTISSFDVDVLDVVAGAGDSAPRILVHVSGPAVDDTGIAEGFSGSPVYCPDAHGAIGNAGAISASVGQYGDTVGLVTPIEQMLGMPLKPPSSVRHAPKLLRSARPLASPLVIAGLSPAFGKIVERAGQRLGRTVLAAPAGPLGTFAPQPLVPGASVSVMYSNGAITAGGVGTVTYRDGTKLWAFGHPMDGVGRRSLPLGDAYVFAVIGNPIGFPPLVSYKLAAPGHVLGTLSSDGPDAVAGTVGAPPPTIPVRVTIRDDDRHRTIRQLTNVADETDVGNPLGSSALSLIAPIAVAQAAWDAFAGAPAQASGRLCLRVHVREAHDPLQFCKRYVISGDAGADMPPPLALAIYTDVTQALGFIDGAGFAALHVTKVDAGVSFERGLRLATIVDARGPRSIRAGHIAHIALRTRIYHGALRTVHFRYRVPADTKSSKHVAVRFSGTPLDSGEDSFFDFGFGDLPAAQSIPELAAEFALTAGDEGVTARIGHDVTRVYRDPRMRIDGDAVLQLKVIGRKPEHKKADAGKSGASG